MTRLEVRNISVSYGAVCALRGLTMAVGGGEIVALVGANGAGKSTLLKSIIGLTKVNAGEIMFDGQRLDRMAPPGIVQAGIAISPEGRRLFSGMLVQENLLLGAYQAGRQAAQTLEEVYAYLPLLRERRGQMAGSLSGGQQQMVAIGRALMARPKLLLLDEPSLGLAPMMVREIVRIIRAIHGIGVSVLLVEQNARMALKLCGRAYVMQTGQVVLSGTGDALLNNPDVQRSYLGPS